MGRSHLENRTAAINAAVRTMANEVRTSCRKILGNFAMLRFINHNGVGVWEFNSGNLLVSFYSP